MAASSLCWVVKTSFNQLIKVSTSKVPFHCPSCELADLKSMIKAMSVNIQLLKQQVGDLPVPPSTPPLPTQSFPSTSSASNVLDKSYSHALMADPRSPPLSNHFSKLSLGVGPHHEPLLSLVHILLPNYVTKNSI